MATRLRWLATLMTVMTLTAVGLCGSVAGASRNSVNSEPLSSPNATTTPGVATTSLTSAEVCGKHFQRAAARRVVSKKLTSEVFSAYGIPKKHRTQYGIDLLVPASLGGSSQIKNLWPIPASQVQKKTAVDVALTHSVCEGFIPLATAQTAVASHWTTITINTERPAPTVSVTYTFLTTGQSPLVRFVATITNPGVYPVTGAVVSWTAYNSANAIVGSHTHDSYPINALSSITYVGGAGSVNLSGPPAKVTATITNPGTYVRTVPPTFTVSTIAVSNSTIDIYSDATPYTVSADVTIGGTRPVASADLDVSIVLVDASGAPVGATFYDTATKLPAMLNPGTKVAIQETSVPATGTPTSAVVTAGVDPAS